MTKHYHTPHGVFEWDEAKAKSNLKKHGISFETAAASFMDSNGVLMEDILHSDDEERFHWIGSVDNSIILLTVFAENGSTRIISARYANKREVKIYVAQWISPF